MSVCTTNASVQPGSITVQILLMICNPNYLKLIPSESQEYIWSLAQVLSQLISPEILLVALLSAVLVHTQVNAVWPTKEI